MKLKDFSATKLFSKQFETIFGKEATFGDITKVKKNSNGNLLGVHVESFVKEKKKENELLKAREEKRQRAWKLAEVTEPVLVKQLAGN